MLTSELRTKKLVLFLNSTLNLLQNNIPKCFSETNLTSLLVDCVSGIVQLMERCTCHDSHHGSCHFCVFSMYPPMKYNLLVLNCERTT